MPEVSPPAPPPTVVVTETASTSSSDSPQSTKSRKFIKFSPRLRKKSRSKGEDAVKGSMETTTTTGATSGGRGHSLQIPNGLNEKEKQELESVFEMFDKNKDGKISCEELGVVLRTLGHRYSHAEIEDMIKNADKNDNGFVEYDEFVLLMKRASAASASPEGEEAEAATSAVPQERPGDDGRAAFEIFDMDGNGYIDRHELRFIMSRLGENPEEEDICEMFRHADLNGDGLIDYEEFTLLMATMAQGGPKKVKGGAGRSPTSKSKSKKK
ncbi:hypothetical protein ACOMHN_017218 [Nucella lapillus]